MWATDYKTDNNVTDHFPGVVSDGRLFTSYVPDAMENDNIKKANSIKTNTQYREYLIKNTNALMKMNYDSMILQNNHPEMNHRIQSGPPVLFKDIHDESKPYGYENTFAKNIFLSRERLDDQKRRPMKPRYDV